MIRRKHYYFYGRVQGVGFRFQTYRYATHLGLTGWVRNLYDGSVEACIQGDEARILDLLRYLNNDSYISINRMEVEDLEVLTEEKVFLVK